jgi:hypothetical protein
LKEAEESGEIACGHGPDEWGKGIMVLSKVSRTGGGRDRTFELIMMGRSAFCDEQSVRSIVIVAPLYSARITAKLAGQVLDMTREKVPV